MRGEGGRVRRTVFACFEGFCGVLEVGDVWGSYHYLEELLIICQVRGIEGGVNGMRSKGISREG